MKIFVTGANGFIGSAFCETALSRGHEVLGMVRRADAVLPTGCVQVNGSLSEIPWQAVENFEPDTALHLAWAAAPGMHLHSPDNETLVQESDDLFRGLVARGARMLTGTGTFIEYAASPMPLQEDCSPLAPLAPYSRAKVETCRRLRELADSTGATWTWFRVFNAFGERESPARLISATMLSLAAGRPAELRTPHSIRDYIHVADVVRGMLHALEHRLSGPINLGSGTGTRIFDLACLAADVVGAERALIHQTDPRVPDLMPVAIADNSKLRATGWTPQVSLRDGLKRLSESLKS